MNRLTWPLRRSRTALALLCLMLLAPGAARAQTRPPKSTVMVPMRDGTPLATDLYLPSGAGPWPVALVRTPYNKIGVGGQIGIPPTRFATSGIALLAQDVRGRGASKGTARPNLSSWT